MVLSPLSIGLLFEIIKNYARVRPIYSLIFPLLDKPPLGLLVSYKNCLHHYKGQVWNIINDKTNFKSWSLKNNNQKNFDAEMQIHVFIQLWISTFKNVKKILCVSVQLHLIQVLLGDFLYKLNLVAALAAKSTRKMYMFTK